MNLGGPAFCVINLSKGIPNTLVATGEPGAHEGDLAKELESEWVRIKGLKRGLSPITDLRALSRLKALIKQYKPDLVHTHTAKAGFLGRLAGKLSGLSPKMVHTFHGHVLDSYFGPIPSLLFKKLEQYLARSTDAFVAVAPSVRDELVEIHGVGDKDQYRIIPSGMPELDLEGEPLYKSPDPVVGMAARMTSIKGYDFLMEVIPSILKEAPKIKFLLVGDGPQREKIRSKIKALGLQDSILLPGAQEKMGLAYKSMDLLVIPSKKEGLPTVALEAAMARVPMVGAAIPGIKDLLVHEKSGLLYSPGSKEGLKNAVLKLVAEKNLQDSLVKEAKRTVKVISYQEVVNAHIKLYQELLNP